MKFKIQTATQYKMCIVFPQFIDHLMAGVEDVIGKSGHNSLQHRSVTATAQSLCAFFFLSLCFMLFTAFVLIVLTFICMV